jgi:hypothetical protein
MKTSIYTLNEAVTFVAACFPFNGSNDVRRLKLRQEHFKRKHHE